MRSPRSDDGSVAARGALPSARLRIDKWLWHARFFKTRSLAARFVDDRHVRVDGRTVDKPGATVMPGNVLTFGLGDRVRVIRIVALGERRGPAPEARTLYDDLEPTTPPATAARA